MFEDIMPFFPHIDSVSPKLTPYLGTDTHLPTVLSAFLTIYLVSFVSLSQRLQSSLQIRIASYLHHLTNSLRCSGHTWSNLISKVPISVSPMQGSVPTFQYACTRHLVNRKQKNKYSSGKRLPHICPFVLLPK